MSGRHADPVDTAEAVVWTEAIRLQAATLAEQLTVVRASVAEAPDCTCFICRSLRDSAILLRQIAEANR